MSKKTLFFENRGNLIVLLLLLTLGGIVVIVATEYDIKFESRENIPSNPQIDDNLKFLSPNQTIQTIEENKITYANNTKIAKLHWDHLPLKYYIENEKFCGEYESNHINGAFLEIANETRGIVNFEKANDTNKVDILVNCSFIKNCYSIKKWHDDNYKYTNESICEHTLGKSMIIADNGQITSAHIELIGLDGFAEKNGPNFVSGFSIGNCGHLNVEIHEILHALGFNHVNDTSSIMYPQELSNVIYQTYKYGDCEGSKTEIDKDIIDSLISTYKK